MADNYTTGSGIFALKGLKRPAIAGAAAWHEACGLKKMVLE
jgi:hypothetical protein